MTVPETPTVTPARVGIAAGVLYAAMVGWQRAAGIELGDPGTAVLVNQTGIVLGMLGFVVLAVGLWRARPGGDGGLARSWPLVLAFGWAALAAAIPLEVLSGLGAEENPLNPVGGIAQLVGLLGLGATVARAGRWQGWRRWFPLGFAVFYAGIVGYTAVSGSWPSAPVELAWALGYSVLGWALLTAGDSDQESGSRSRRAAAAGR